MTASGPTLPQVPSGPTGPSERARPSGPAPGLLYEEHLNATPRSWLWLLVAAAVTFIAIAPIIVPLTVVAWLVNVGRYAHTGVRIDADRVWVGRRSVRLAALDLSTLGHASNTWPWRAFNARYLGANPIWTSDSVGIRGVDGGQTHWVSVGTNHRAELVTVLERAIPAARVRAEASAAAYAGMRLPPPGWHDDPWLPGAQLRWWDGLQWTSYATPRPGWYPDARRDPGAPS